MAFVLRMILSHRVRTIFSLVFVRSPFHSHNSSIQNIGMAEKYGLPGDTDSEGFNPYADTVGAGICGGIGTRETEIL